jgi:hypothetical protein
LLRILCSLLQERLETGLFKVVIGGLGNAVLFPHDKRNAVGEGPILVLALGTGSMRTRVPSSRHDAFQFHNAPLSRLSAMEHPRSPPNSPRLPNAPRQQVTRG